MPPISNREDLVLTISIFDDDTGDPINLSYTVTASGLPFTGSNWMVTSGAVSVAYTGTITIPTPPINDELTAFTIPIGLGAGFVAGQPIKIVDPTGANYMLGTITGYSNGNLVCQIGTTFQFEIRRQAPRDDNWGGYWPFTVTGVVDSEAPIIVAALGTGITIIDVGYIQVLILESQLRSLLYLATFGAYLTMTDSVNTRQIMIANLPVLYGGVTQ